MAGAVRRLFAPSGTLRCSARRRCDAVDLSDATAVLLVGGLGTRLRPVVSDRPKVLAEVHGRPFVAYILDQLADSGVRHVVLCTGFQGDRVRRDLGEGFRGMRLEYSQETTPLGTGGALRLALPLIKSDPVLVMNGDSYCSVDLRQFWSFYQERQPGAALVLAEMPDCRRFGKVSTDREDHIVSFEEKEETQSSGWVNAGIYLIGLPWLVKIQKHVAVSLERDVFPSWIPSQGVRYSEPPGFGSPHPEACEFLGFRSTSRLFDIGTPEAFDAASKGAWQP